MVLNVLFPGSGTIVAACAGDWPEGQGGGKQTQIAIGVFQLLTAIYLIGWLSSIYWGYLIIIKSQGEHTEMTTLLNRVQGKSDQDIEDAAVSKKQRQKANNPYDDGAYEDEN